MVDPPACQALDCAKRSLTQFTDGAGKVLDLCEEHGDLLAVGFPLKRPDRVDPPANETGDERAELERLLGEVYLPDGVRIWMTARHKQWDGLTVEQMFAAGRGDEVLQRAEQLATGAFS